MKIVDNYQELALNDIPMIDVRAPVEFLKGSIFNAVNLPLMDDSQRHQVGICYKEHGKDKAIELGHQLVGIDIKADRIQQWCNYFDANPNTHIFCARGGLRSKISQQWLIEAGRDIPLIKGGYKAFRNYLINATTQTLNALPLRIVGGQTGCGKTELLAELDGALDLERLANHRGSAFGKDLTPQPSQINFENQIAKALLQLKVKKHSHIIVEDESRLIGRCALPLPLKDKMARGPVYLLEDTFDRRVQRILQDYVIKMEARFCQQYGDLGFHQLSEHLHKAFDGIKKRLGAKKHQALVQVLDSALQRQQSQNDANDHIQWIEVLLTEYYDPLYQYQLGKKLDRIVYRGNKGQLLEQLNHHYQG